MTTMSPPTCVVLVDGVALNDGTDLAAVPVVLTDLDVTWGRADSIDQPSPSSCSLSLLDTTNGWLAAVGLGRRLEIRSDATLYPDPDVSTIPAIVPGAVTAATLSVAGDGQAAAIVAQPGPTNRAAQVVLPPLAFTDDPTGWDTVPRTAAGQSWTMALTVSLPPGPFAGWDGWAATLAPVAFTDPAGPGTILTDLAVPADGPTTARFVPPPGVWLGLAVRVYPTGPTWEQLDATPWAALDPTWTWDTLATTVIHGLELLAPAAGAIRTAVVFSGRITDLDARNDTGDRTLIDIIAVDDLAELGSRLVGDVPWLVESLAARFARIVQQSGQPVHYVIDPSVAGALMSWRDVDSSPAAGLLSELAMSVDGILWSATHAVTGPQLMLDAVAGRPGMMVLVLVEGVVVIRPDPASDAVQVDACDVLLEPVRWRQDTTDVTTRIAVTWRDQTVDDHGNPQPTDRTYQIVNTDLEYRIGALRTSVATQLTTQAAAAAVAGAMLGRLAANISWRVSGLTWDLAVGAALDADTTAAVMTFLDGTTRLGCPVMLTNLPAWSPVPTEHGDVPLYVEGGRYRHQDGAWRLELLTSSAVAQGTSALAWNELPADWSWDEFDPDLSWADLAGVTGVATVED